jgi:multidrug transporter EmrE-like cation transporter
LGGEWSVQLNNLTLSNVTFGENKMNAVKMLAVVLIVAGGLGLIYGGFSYTKETHQTKIGPIELSVKDTERVNVPIWAGVAAMVAGVILLVARK